MRIGDLVKKLTEGGNLELANPQDSTRPYKADEIDLKVHRRDYIVPILDKLLRDINNSFYSQYNKPIWSSQLLSSKQFLGGSSLHFFDTAGINDQQFTKLKPKVGDIDTQCNKELQEEIKEFLIANDHKQIGDSTLLGFRSGNEQFNALFQFQDPPMKIQIDFEFGRYNPETNTPDEWFRFSHSSDWNDLQAGIKGVFHKYLYRALSGTTSKQAYIAKLAGRGKARDIQISDEPATINTVSFAVSSKQGGGVSRKYGPYIDPATNQPMIKNGLPVLQEIPSAERNYEQQLNNQFTIFFGQAPEPEDTKLQQSFVGTLDLINKYVSDQKKLKIAEDFLEICFEPGSQMITRDDPKRDAETKFAAVDVMLEKLGLQSLRTHAIQMAQDYETDYQEVEAFKKKNPGEKQPRAALKKLKAAEQPMKEEKDLKIRNHINQQPIAEAWSDRYKKSINCSHPKGFSQRAHCAGKKKHNENMSTMEMTCPDCGKCQTHGNLAEIKKGQKDSNGYTKCRTGYRAAGTKKSSTTGKTVRNCVPIGESLEMEMASALLTLLESQLTELRSLASHKGYTQMPRYKRYNIFVTKKKYNNIAYIARAEDPRTKDERFNANAPTPQEAVDKLHAKIDNIIEIAKKVSGPATICFNVDFFRETLEMSTRPFYAKIIPGPKLVMAGSEMENFPEIMKDEGFKISSPRAGENSQTTNSKLPGVQLSMQDAIRANIIANGRYILTNETTDKDGNRVFDLEFDSVVADTRERIPMGEPAVTIGTLRGKQK